MCRLTPGARAEGYASSMRRPHLVLLIPSILLAAASARAAGVVGNGTPGSCTEAALNAALTGGGSVSFNCGPGPVTIGITSQKTIAAATTLDGGNLVTLDGGNATRLFLTNYQVPFTVRNLTLQNARTTDVGAAIRAGYQAPLTVTDSRFYGNVCTQAGPDVGGGAIYVQGGDTLVQRVTFSGNRGGNGGAMGNLQSRTTIEDSFFAGNQTNAGGTGGGAGGALYVDGSNGGSITIRRTVFEGNVSTGLGGAIHTYLYAGASQLVVEDSLFRDNSTQNNGGAIYHQNGGLTIERSTFDGNQTVGQGGALWLLETWSGVISNSTFTGNRANGVRPNNGSTGLGGAILLNANNNVTLQHLTIADNFADWVGGGICGGASVTLRGSIVAHNTVLNGGNPWNIAHNCCTQMTDGGGNLQFPNRANPSDPNDPNCTAGVVIGDPLLLPLADNGGLTPTRATPAGSPARERVTSGCPPPATDQRGVARPQGAACDAGAWEAPEPAIAIAAASRAEGNAGSALLSLAVSLSEPASETVTVAYATSDVDATAGLDYTPVSGTLTFPVGATIRTVDVPVLGDLLDENDESLRVTLSSPVNATLASSQALGTILDDDPLPSLTIGDAALAEGDAGTRLATLTVTLSAPSGRAASVSFATAAGTATSPADFGSVSGTLDFPPGTTARSLSVPVFGDALDEPDESFAVNLSAAQNAAVADGQGLVTIQDDDAPGLAVEDLTVAEGPAGATTATFRVRLAPAPSGTVTVDYATVDGSALAGSDYGAAAGSLSFDAAHTERTVAVSVSGDLLREGPETFTLQLSNASGAPVARAAGTATVIDFQPPDWNADGQGDLLFRHAVSGRSVLWLMNGLTRVQGLFTTPDGWPDTSWQVRGTRDFDLDGRTDLLWRRETTGELRLWLMNGSARVAELPLAPERLADTNWQLAATGELDGDGQPDLIFRHAASGRMVVWLMQGAARRQGTFTSPDQLADLNWRLAGTGDFDGDQHADLLWQHAVSGKLVAWLMNGTARVGASYLTPSGVADSAWSVHAVGDFTGDGKPDLLWRHAVSGKLVAWVMDGLLRQSGQFLSPDTIGDLNWRIVGPR